MSSLDGILYLKPKKNFVVVLIIFLFIMIILLIMFFKYTYDVYHFTGVVQCEEECLLNINASLSDVEKLVKGENLKINNRELNYEIKEIGAMELDYLTMTNYQKIVIDAKLNKSLKKDNLSIKLSVCLNKERVLKKMIKKFI